VSKTTQSYYQLNRGLVSRLALARMDIKRTAMSAQIMTNYMPRVLGSMMLRPGMAYLGGTLNNMFAKYLPFIFATTDTALLELTDQNMRVWVGDAVVARPAVTTTVANGNFVSSLAGWTATGGVTQVAPGYAQFIGNGTTNETLDQTVTVGGNAGVLHALRIVIARGPVGIRVGTAAGDDSYVSETTLLTGTHSLAFIPTGNFTIRFFSPLLRIVWVDSCNVEAAGQLVIPTPWIEADLYSVRWDQSADVVFVACSGQGGNNYQQRRIERRDNNSWSVVLYQTTDGPYRAENVGPITLTPSGPHGNITVAASAAVFSANQIGALYSITQQGQFVTVTISAQNTFSNPIQVTGVGEQRRYAFTVTGTWVGTVTTQRSVGVVGNWVDVTTTTGDTTGSDNDGLDNQVVFYRIGIKTGDYVSGTAVASLTYNLGSIRGVVRVTDFFNSMSVGAEVLVELGANLLASDVWSEGSWSDKRGWPTAPVLYEGRLWWSGKNGIFGSVSDAFDDYAPDIDGTAGDAGTINRTIGSGPVDDINWLMGLQRLIIGAQGTEFSARSTALDEPLTPTNFNIKGSTTQGSANVLPAKIDSRGVFVQKSGVRVYELEIGTANSYYDYDATDMTALVPEIGLPSIVTLAVQRQPDTRIHCVRSDGVVAVAVIDHVENVLSWQMVETEGGVIDAVVLPGEVEDQVYYSVQRVIDNAVTNFFIIDGGAPFVVALPGATPAVTVSGAGSGAQVVAILSPVNNNPTSGIGYSVNDVLTAQGGTTTVNGLPFGLPLVFKVLTIDGSGRVLSVSVLNPGAYSDVYGAGSAFSGGTGTGFQFTAPINAKVTDLRIIFGGSGYSGVTTTTIAGLSTNILTTVGSKTSFQLSKWALESECVGGTLNKQADSFIIYDGPPTTVITGLDHLEGFDVVVWADGKDLSPLEFETQVQIVYPVIGGQIQFVDGIPVSQAIVGLSYTAQWQSTKLAFAGDPSGSWLNQRKSVTQLGLIMADFHSQGVKYGPDFDHLDPMPRVEEGEVIDYNTVWPEYDFDMMEFQKTWSTDSRICLQSMAPRPCTILAITMTVEEHGKG
jgi:hypothetical protein